MQKERKFQKLLKPNKYQVLVFSCPGNIPFNFASHNWFVLNKKGKVSRWELLFRTHGCKTSWGHLHKNALPLFKGIDVFPYFNKLNWKPKLVGLVEGNENSQAAKLIKYIEKSKNTYPYVYNYSLINRNSNTYAKWILSKFPNIKIKLPSNSFG